MDHKHLREQIIELKLIVSKQMFDDSIFFDPENITEVFLQNTIRELHSKIVRLGYGSIKPVKIST